MVLNQNEYTMASLGYKLSYTTLITPNQTEPCPPYNTKTDGPPPFLHLLHFLTFDFSPSLADRRRAAAPAPPPPPSNHSSFLTLQPRVLSPSLTLYFTSLLLQRWRGVVPATASLGKTWKTVFQHR